MADKWRGMHSFIAQTSSSVGAEEQAGSNMPLHVEPKSASNEGAP